MVGDIGMNPESDLRTAQQTAARVAAMTDVRDVRLMRSSAEIVRLPVDSPFLTYELSSEAVVEYEPGGESFVVRGKYRVSITTTPNASAEDASTSGTVSDVAKIEFEQAALFVMNLANEEPPQDNELNAYAVTTGQFALYPYVREYISDITYRLGLPALTVGVLRLPIDERSRE